VITYEDVKLSDEVVKCLCQPNRLLIIDCLHQHTELTVTDLCAHMALDQGLISHHLRVLTKIRVLDARKNGKFTHYSVNYIRLAQIRSALIDLVRN